LGEQDGEQNGEQSFSLAIGARVRSFRQGDGLRLVDLSNKTGLSVSFLSQLERGLTAASMRSLIRIAEALGRTPHQLMADPPEGTSRWSITRREDSVVVRNDSGTARPIVERNASFSALEFEGGPTRYFGSYYHLSGDHLLYVVSGTFEIDIDGVVSRLGPGDSAYTAAGVPLRWRRIGRGGRLVSFLPLPGIDHPSELPGVEP
jgi:transcriptional regulator with XRE-family HTH domain